MKSISNLFVKKNNNVRFVALLLSLVVLCSSTLSSFAYESNYYYPTIENIPLDNPVWNFVKNDAIIPFFDGVYNEIRLWEDNGFGMLVKPLSVPVRYFVPQTQQGSHGGSGSSRDPIIVNTDPVVNPQPIVKPTYNYTTNNTDIEIYDIDNNSYEFVNNTYVYNDYYIYETDNYYISYDFNYTYYSVVVAPISDPSAGKYYKLYYELPDGRSSYNLTPNDIRGTVFNYDVVNYEKTPSESNVLGIWHLDGDFYNSVDNSYINNDGWSSSNFFQGRFNGSITNFNGTTFSDIWLPFSGSVGSDYTLEFWLYVPYQDTVLNSSLYTGNGVTGYRNITINDSIPQECWSYITLCSNGTWFVNGNKMSSAAPAWLFGSEDSIVTIFGSNVRFRTMSANEAFTVAGGLYTSYYGYRFSYDEVKLTNGIVYTDSFNPRMQPWDLTYVYTIPHGEYWEEREDNIVSTSVVFDDVEAFQPLGNLNDHFVKFPGWSTVNHIPPDYNSNTGFYTVGFKINDGVTIKGFMVPVSVFDSPSITITDISIPLIFRTLDSSFGNLVNNQVSGSYTYTFSSKDAYVLIYPVAQATLGYFKFQEVPSSISVSNGVITVDQSVSSDGLISVGPFNAANVVDFNFSTSGGPVYPRNINFDFDVPFYVVFETFKNTYYEQILYFSSTPNRQGLLKYINSGVSSNPMSFTYSDLSFTSNESVIVDSGYYDFERPTIAIQSPFEIKEAQIGGIRKNKPSVGDVFISLDDNRSSGVSQYFNGVWNSVDGAIFIDGKWHDLMKFDFSTLMLVDEEKTETPTIIINNYYFGSDSVSDNDLYDPSGTNHPDDPTASDGSLTVLKKISKTLNLWFAAWSIGEVLDFDIDENNHEAKWYDILLPLIYVIYLLIVLISILKLVLSSISYLFHLISIPALSTNLPDGFLQAFYWLRGQTEDPFYLLDFGTFQVTCFDFMVLIFEIAFIGTTILIIRKQLSNIHIPSYRD